MASRLNPYLNFTDTARPAMEFYQQVFGGELTVNTFGQLGAAEGPVADLVMHSLLETSAGYTIMASDAPEGMVPGGPRPTGSLSIAGEAADADALRGYWEQLSGSGSVTMPMEKQVWGDEFGMCVDKYGVSWMVNIAGSDS